VRILIQGTAAAIVAVMGTTSAVAADDPNTPAIEVCDDIAVSTTWTADNTYDLVEQIFVLPGASLTIEAGTVVASTPTANGAGSLAVTRGAQLFICGTKDDPVIFTSKNDVATWDPDPNHPTGGDPKTGEWRASANEWGNITIMGRGFISENATPTNVPTCDADNVATMEGLIAQFPGDQNVLYGGGDDNDDSGKIEYLSIRYGGRVIGLNNELNGLSLGGIGRETDISHVEIMNNVDDGIEIWGGCVQIKYFSIWNVGDDSLDVDQGYRGKVQFGLIVQGYSLDASQGSGIGDNGCETDGAEDSDWQPVTTTTFYNLTVIGQPLAGDGLTAWRDNARVQYRNCILMDGGEKVVRFDDVDGDGANGYGHNGTLTWLETWDTAYDAVPPTPNDCPPGTYKAQSSGNLSEIVDSVLYRNLAANAYDEAINVGVLDAGNDNVRIDDDPNEDQLPIQKIVRGDPVFLQGGSLVLLPVECLDPQPANDAICSVDFCAGDDFFCAVKYRGAFAPGWNWLGTWTASFAFDFTVDRADVPWCDLGCGLAGVCGWPLLSADGPLTDGSANSLSLIKGAPNAVATLFVSLVEGNAPFKGGVLKTVPFILQLPLPLDASGEITLPFTWPSGIPAGTEIFFQFVVPDTAAVKNFAISNAVRGTAE